MKAIWKGVIVAESSDTIVVEGNHYFPPNALKTEFVEDSSHESICGWKGLCNYKTLNVNGEKNPNAVWYYANPKPAAANIRGYFAFWKGVVVQE